MVRELSDDYVVETAALLNSEWPRSTAQRCDALRSQMRHTSAQDSATCKMPVSLILVQQYDDTEASTHRVVIGHLNLVAIATTTAPRKLIFIQSVIVHKEWRGKGLGKQLMLLSEEYVSEFARGQAAAAAAAAAGGTTSEHIDTECLYLTTKDKQAFYESLGYVRIEPREFYVVKSDSKCSQILKSLFESANKPASNSIASQVTEPNAKIQTLPSTLGASSPPPPPPPPPPPVPTNVNLLSPLASQQQTWYMKSISQHQLNSQFS